jgi:hypothetical protein
MRKACDDREVIPLCSCALPGHNGRISCDRHAPHTAALPLGQTPVFARSARKRDAGKQLEPQGERRQGGEKGREKEEEEKQGRRGKTPETRAQIQKHLIKMLAGNMHVNRKQLTRRNGRRHVGGAEKLNLRNTHESASVLKAGVGQAWQGMEGLDQERMSECDWISKRVTSYSLSNAKKKKKS